MNFSPPEFGKCEGCKKTWSACTLRWETLGVTCCTVCLHLPIEKTPPAHRIRMFWQSDFEPFVDCSCGWTYAPDLDHQRELDLARYAAKHFEAVVYPAP